MLDYTTTDYENEMETLSGKWGSVLEHNDFVPIADRWRKKVTARLLENTVKEMEESRQGIGNMLFEAAPTNSMGQSSSTAGSGGIDTYDPVLIGMLRRSVPNLMAFDIMGVQPMTMPTGLVFSLRSTYKQQESSAGARDATEALFNEANSGWSGQSANTLSGSPNTGSPWSNAQTAGTDFSNLTAGAFNFGSGMDTYALEELGDAADNQFNEMAFTIDKTVVEAKGRALKAEYTRELAHDLRKVHGLDAEAELANILSTEIIQEINREMIRRVYWAAKIGAQNGQTATAGVFNCDVDGNGRWFKEKHLGLAFQLTREANTIAKLTRRGKGNVLITSSDVAAALDMAGKLHYDARQAASLNVDDTGNTFAGMFGNMKVFIDPYYTSNGNEYAVVGYKGQANSYDAGMFYCPYVPLEMVRAVGEDTFAPKIGFKTRYGVVNNPFVNKSGVVTGQTNFYYSRISISNIM